MWKISSIANCIECTEYTAVDEYNTCEICSIL